MKDDEKGQRPTVQDVTGTTGASKFSRSRRELIRAAAAAGAGFAVTPLIPVTAAAHGINAERRFNAQAPVLGIIDVTKAPFGCDPLGLVDATARLNAAAKAAAALAGPVNMDAQTGSILYAPPGSKFLISGQINIQGHCDFTDCRFFNTTMVYGPLVNIGPNPAQCAAGNRLENVKAILPAVEQKCEIRWSGGSYISTAAGAVETVETGVRCINLLHSRIVVDHISNYTIGLMVYAMGNGGFCAYNTFDGSHMWLEGNKCGLWTGTDNNVAPPGAGGVSYSACDENHGYGGRFSVSSALDNPVGTVHWMIPPSPSNINGWVWFAPSLEGAVSGGVCTPQFVQDNYGAYNGIIHGRYDGYGLDPGTRPTFHFGKQVGYVCKSGQTADIAAWNNYWIHGFYSERVRVQDDAHSNYSYIDPLVMHTGVGTASALQIGNLNSIPNPPWIIPHLGHPANVTAYLPDISDIKPVLSPASVYLQPDGAPGAQAFIKTAGTQNIGWIPIHGAIASNNQTGTTYTLVATDAGKVIECNNSTRFTLVIDANRNVPFPVGTIIEVWQQGAGTVTVVGRAPVTLRAQDGNVSTAGQYTTVRLRQRAIDEWVVTP